MNTWDEAKRQATLRERGLDFADAEEVFRGRALTLPDERRDYGETRFITAGWPKGVLLWSRGRRGTVGDGLFR